MEHQINLLVNRLPWIKTYSSFSLDYKKSPFEGDYLSKIKNNIFLGLCISKHPSELGDFTWQNIRGDHNLQKWIFGENSKLKKEHKEIWKFYQGWYITDIVKGDNVSDYFWEKSGRDRQIFQKGSFIMGNLTLEIKQKCLKYFEIEREIFSPLIVIIFGSATKDVLKEILGIKDLQIKFLELPYRKLEYFVSGNTKFYCARHYAMGNYIGQLYRDLIGIYNENRNSK